MTKPTPQPEPKKRAPLNRFAHAGRVASRLAELDSEEAKELAQSPAEIKARFDKKRAAAMDGVPAEVTELVDRMRAEEAAQ